MCRQCGSKNGTTYHLLYWQAEWFKRFLTTWWHIVNRRAYWKWYRRNCSSYRAKKVNKLMLEMNEGEEFWNDEDLENCIRNK